MCLKARASDKLQRARRDAAVEYGNNMMNEAVETVGKRKLLSD